MARTPSTMLPLGTQAPGFTLPNPASGKDVSLTDLQEGEALLVMFICNHCPYVLHVMEEIGLLQRDFAPRGVNMVAINSNNVEKYPQDAPEKMAELVAEQGWDFPFLMDHSQEVAHAYRAACTPDFYLFGKDGTLFYRGQLDGSRPGNDIPVTGKDLRTALEACLGSGASPEAQRPSLGCNIKWKPGNEPDYFAIPSA